MRGMSESVELLPSDPKREPRSRAMNSLIVPGVRRGKASGAAGLTE